MSDAAPAPGKTMLKRIEQYRDRWTSYGFNTGVISLSDKLSPKALAEIEILAEFDARFLEKISPDVSVVEWKKDSVLFEEGSYIDVAFYIVEGEVEVAVGGQNQQNITARPIFQEPQDDSGEPPPAAGRTMVVDIKKIMDMGTGPPANNITFLATMDFDLTRGQSTKLDAGELFGEIGALSGWPQSVTARCLTNCKLVQIRMPALRMMRRKSKQLKARLDNLYRERSLLSQLKTTPLFEACPDQFLQRLTDKVELVSCRPDEVVVNQGEAAEALYLVRSGFIKLTQRVGEGDMVITYLSKGMTFGELELMMDGLNVWESTAISVEYAELVKIPRAIFLEVLQQGNQIEDRLWRNASKKVREAGYSRRNISHSVFSQEALDTGLVQGSSMLAIDLEACTRCDDCVRACAATHGGLPRFVREGNKQDHLLVAKSCFHCRDPVCLVGCPTGAIHRAGIDDVVEIDAGICIGCSTCANNCPYDAIVMHETGQTWPDDMIPTGLRGQPRRTASKCDQCVSVGIEPACVTNCPQGCAERVSSVNAFEGLLSRDPAQSRPRERKLKRAQRWKRAFIFALVLCGAALAANITLSELNPANTWGLGYGIAALVFLVGVSFWAIRRRTMKLSSKLHLGRARSWLYFHFYGGLIFMLLVLMHSGFRIPAGTVNLTLWLLSIWTVASGLGGLVLQQWIPRVLASGLSTEVLYERIHELVTELGERARKLATTCSEPVEALYSRNIAPALAKPERRFIYFFDITGGIQARLREFTYLRRLLPSAEKEKLDELELIFKSKLEIDAQYTLQSGLRVWALAHVPTSLLLLVYVGLHLVSVFLY